MDLRKDRSRLDHYLRPAATAPAGQPLDPNQALEPGHALAAGGTAPAKAWLPHSHSSPLPAASARGPVPGRALGAALDSCGAPPAGCCATEDERGRACSGGPAGEGQRVTSATGAAGRDAAAHCGEEQQAALDTDTAGRGAAGCCEGRGAAPPPSAADRGAAARCGGREATPAADAARGDAAACPGGWAAARSEELDTAGGGAAACLATPLGEPGQMGQVRGGAAAWSPDPAGSPDSWASEGGHGLHDGGASQSGAGLSAGGRGDHAPGAADAGGDPGFAASRATGVSRSGASCALAGAPKPETRALVRPLPASGARSDPPQEGRSGGPHRLGTWRGWTSRSSSGCGRRSRHVRPSARGGPATQRQRAPQGPGPG